MKQQSVSLRTESATAARLSKIAQPAAPQHPVAHQPLRFVFKPQAVRRVQRSTGCAASKCVASTPLRLTLLTSIVIGLPWHLPSYAQDNAVAMVQESHDDLRPENHKNHESPEVKPSTSALVNGQGLTKPMFKLEKITIEHDAETTPEPWQSTIKRSVLERQQITSWEGLSERLDAGVHFNVADRSLNVRGLDKNRVLTTLDGVWQSWLSDIRYGYGPSTHGGLNTFDFNTISQIRVQRGADSSRLGAGALAGAVEITTLEPEDILQGAQDPERDWSAIVQSGYQSVDRRVHMNTVVAGHKPQGFRWMFQAGVASGHERQNRGTNDGFGQARSAGEPLDTNTHSYLLKLRQRLPAGHDIGMTASYFKRLTQTQNRSVSTAEFVPGSSFSQENAERQSVMFDHGWLADHTDAWLDETALKLYWQQVDLSLQAQGDRLQKIHPRTKKTDYPFGLTQRSNTIQAVSYGMNGRVKKSIAAQVSQTWESGVSWQGSQMTQYAAAQNNCPAPAHLTCPFQKSNQADMPKTHGTQWGWWLQNTLGFAQGKFELTPAIRYDHYEYRPEPDAAFARNFAHVPLPNVQAGAWSPKLLAAWHLTQTWQLYGQFAKGFTAPTATQLFSRYGTPQTYLFQGNPQLKPETSQGWELGVRYQDKTLHSSVTYFDNHYSNFIQKVTLAGYDRNRRAYPMSIVGFENLDSVRIHGVEASAAWQLSQPWRVRGSLSWSVGQNTKTQENLNSVAPLTVNLGVEYEQEQWGVGVQWRLVAARSKSHQARSQGAKPSEPAFLAPGYGVVDLTAHWSPATVKGLTVEAGVFNVLNKTYWNALDVPMEKLGHGMSKPDDFYTQPGINLAINLRYQY